MPRDTDYDIDGLLQLWTDPDAGEDDFRRWYTDPVRVNGSTVAAANLATRAATLRSSLAETRRTVLEVVETGDRVAVAFELGGRHVGALDLGAQVLEPTGRDIVVRVIDILSLDADGRIAGITMVAQPQPG